MAEFTKRFGPFTATVDTNMDGEGVSGCWIEYGRLGGSYSASLEAADATGTLSRNNDEMPIPAATVEQIRDWAEKNGY